jgi:hypothetical protein
MSDYVADDEILYRRVVYNQECFTIVESNRLIVTPSAFRDPKNQPSVDRAKLCNYAPTYTQGPDKRNSVVSLVAADIRLISDVVKYGQDPVTYSIDVIPVPILDGVADNIAHAEIRADPRIASDKIFRRLRESLARLANQRGWLIRPEGFR